MEKNKKTKMTPEEKQAKKIARFNKCGELSYKIGLSGLIVSFVPFLNLFFGLGLSVAGIPLSILGSHGTVKNNGLPISIAGTVISAI